MKIDLNIEVKNLSGGKEATTLGKQLAPYLMHTRGLNAYLATKYWHWANEFFSGNAATVDEADRNVIRDFVDGHAEIPVWLKAQLMPAIDPAKGSVLTIGSCQ